MTAVNPMIRLVTIPDAGHLVHCGQPAAFLDGRDLEFLDERAPGARRGLRATPPVLAQWRAGGRATSASDVPRDLVAAAGLLPAAGSAGPARRRRAPTRSSGRASTAPVRRVLGGLLEGRPRPRLPARHARVRQPRPPLHLAARAARPAAGGLVPRPAAPSDRDDRGLQPARLEELRGGARALVRAACRARAREGARPCAARGLRDPICDVRRGSAGRTRSPSTAPARFFPRRSTTGCSSACSRRSTSRCRPSRRVYVTGSEQVSPGLYRRLEARGAARRRRGHRPPSRHQRARGAAPPRRGRRRRRRPRLDPDAATTRSPGACPPLRRALDVELVVLDRRRRRSLGRRRSRCSMSETSRPRHAAARGARPPRSPTSARGSPGCTSGRGGRAARRSSTPTSRTSSSARWTSRTSSTSGGRRSARRSSERRTTWRCSRARLPRLHRAVQRHLARLDARDSRACAVGRPARRSPRS